MGFLYQRSGKTVTVCETFCATASVTSPTICGTSMVKVPTGGCISVSSSPERAHIKRNASYDTLELQGYGAEMMIGSANTGALHINYRQTAIANAPANWYWRCGSSTSWSNHHWGIGCGNTCLQSPIVCATSCLKVAGKIKLDGSYLLGDATYGFRFNSSADSYNNVIMYDDGHTCFRTCTSSPIVCATTSVKAACVCATGNMCHQGLTLSTGTDIDQYFQCSASLTLTTAWLNTGVQGTSLPTGTYIVKVFVSNYPTSGGSQYSVTYSGIMSWHTSSTNDSGFTSEIPLHAIGHADNDERIFLRTCATAAGIAYLQMATTVNTGGSSSYDMCFRRMM